MRRREKNAGLFAALMLMPWMTALPAVSAEGLAGDVNGDGELTLSDAVLLARCLAEATGDLPEGMISVTALDVNGDGKVTAADLSLLLRLISGQHEDSWILEPKGTVHSGYATYYGGGYEGGCAMLDPVSRDYWITAMNLADYNCAELAGAYLEVTGELGTIHVLVTDLLPEGAKGDLDLYVDAFPLIAPAEKGKVPVTWKIIPLDSAADAPMSYRYKEGSSAYWCGIQVLNHRYPIETLEVLVDGEFVELPRMNYNYFIAESGLGSGPFTLRITDIYGQRVIDEDIPFTPDETQQGHAQLPE